MSERCEGDKEGKEWKIGSCRMKIEKCVCVCLMYLMGKISLFLF